LRVEADERARARHSLRVFRATTPESRDVYRRSEAADAEPAVAGWCMRVDDVFAI